ncbi:hypothetical protein ACD591_07330 [Rufibacter glacialis]|uniref:Uncharacterized protein n=1 Tax=Rufibacter glacialis TaxID=1259555 RepID=A0ABV4RE80_9BACT|nr:hypothetical protein [Rufibacter glacialis]
MKPSLALLWTIADRRCSTWESLQIRPFFLAKPLLKILEGD